MKPIHKRRLLKLANHLEKGKLGHKTFDMLSFNDGPKDKRGCGTHGCAIGECPIVFPKYWCFKREEEEYLPSLKSAKYCDLVEEQVGDFFGISPHGVRFLFILRTNLNLTRKQQARRIREYVKKRSNK